MESGCKENCRERTRTEAGSGSRQLLKRSVLAENLRARYGFGYDLRLGICVSKWQPPAFSLRAVIVGLEADYRHAI